MKSKSKKSKLYWKLIKLQEENRAAQDALGYKPLDKPIHYGYTSKWELRDDVSRREDSWVFEAILNDHGKSVWCKTKDFTVYDISSRSKRDLKPFIEKIDEDIYNRIYPRYQKWFSYLIGGDIVRWSGVKKMYGCNIPEYFFKKVIEKNYKTHYKVIDEVLKQEEAEIEDAIQREFYGKRYRGKYSGVPKWYRHFFDKKDKYRNKREINCLVK